MLCLVIGVIVFIFIIVAGYLWWNGWKCHKTRTEAAYFLSYPVNMADAQTVAVSGWSSGPPNSGGTSKTFQMITASELRVIASKMFIENCSPCWVKIVEDELKAGYPGGVALAAVSSSGACAGDNNVTGVGLYALTDPVYKSNWAMYLH